MHSTEVYIPLNMNESPFNVGLAIELPEFTQAQVSELAMRHALELSDQSVMDLMNMVGGHPYLTRVALYTLQLGEQSLGQLLQEAPTDAGLFGDHLRRHLWNLEQHSELAKVMRQVVWSEAPVTLTPRQGFLLESMGLVRLKGNAVTPRYELYRLYFRDRLRTIE